MTKAEHERDIIRVAEVLEQARRDLEDAEFHAEPGHAPGERCAIEVDIAKFAGVVTAFEPRLLKLCREYVEACTTEREMGK